MRVSSAIVFGVVFGFTLSMASCGPAPKPCGPSTCQGCCDSNGECLAGTAVFECGAGGSMCLACQSNELCRTGVCETFDGGDYDANFPGARDASINFDAGLFDAGPIFDAGVDAGIDAGRIDSGVVDSGVRMDAGTTDAGRVDSGVMDSGVMDAGRPDAGPPVSFMTDLVPVFSNYCVSCHTNRATYADVRARVTPNNPSGSLLFQKITATQSTGQPMPFGTAGLFSVDPPATALIERWILQGALNN